MAIAFKIAPIVPLSETLSLVIGKFAEVEPICGGFFRIVSMSPDCIITDKGYWSDSPRLWEGAIAERLHPWPIPDFMKLH